MQWYMTSRGRQIPRKPENPARVFEAPSGENNITHIERRPAAGQVTKQPDIAPNCGQSVQAQSGEEKIHEEQSAERQSGEEKIHEGQSAEAQNELEEQYQMLSQSLDYLGLVVIAVMVSYFTLDAQKQQLGAVLRGELESLPETNYFPMQFASAAMVLCSTSFYSNLSKDILRQPQPDPQAAQLNEINAFANELVLLAAAVRIYALLTAEFCPGAPAEKEQEEAQYDAQAPFVL